MSANPQLEFPVDRITAFCHRWGVRELALFGSALRDDFRPDSDVDVLVSFLPGVKPTLGDLDGMARELEDLFGRPVDLVERRAVEQSPNYLRRQKILSTAEVVYGA
jgi:predicted nucleotidyltransferase